MITVPRLSEAWRHYALLLKELPFWPNQTVELWPSGFYVVKTRLWL